MAVSETFTADAAVELAVVERSGFDESRHVGSAVLLDPSGTPAASLGAVDEPVLVRSTLKPLQAIASMRRGADLTGPALGLATASHRAELRHIDAVADMLASAGLDESHLRCPAVAPADRTARDARTAAGQPTSRLHFNCSGKHAAFLLAAVAGGHPTASYLDPTHPVQQEVERVVEDFSGGPSLAVGVDGCGAPVHALTLTALATAISHVARGADEHSAQLMDGVFAHPWTVEGADRPNTTVIEELGVFAKFGAEGVMVMATRTGWSVAAKCLDGSSRPTTLTALRLLEASGEVSGEDSQRVLDRLVQPVTGGIDDEGRPAVVGRLRDGAALRSLTGGPR